MIIVKLMGGLGNQMFQYAAGRRLAHIHHADLKLDPSSFNDSATNDTARRYELDAFNIEARFGSAGDIPLLRIAASFGNYGPFLMSRIPLLRHRHIVEKHYSFDQAVLSLRDNVYLEGYWQSERYFADIAAIIRKDFTFRTSPDAINRQAAERISKFESVSMHIRRGDYISNAVTSSYHGTCSLEYYRAAVKTVTARAGNVRFFLFSDDPAWVRQHMSWIPSMTVVDHNGPDKAYEDMRLMSLCRHHVIANSSFSWWAAWLSSHPGKIVIAPKQWFKNPAIDTNDLIPHSWTRL